jgi:D-tyrosyl-tRNA(Tyr) deacylase
MRLCVQRVSGAKVVSGDRELGAIGPGLLVLAGFGAGDEDLPGTRAWSGMIDKMLGLRIFPDNAGRLDVSVARACPGGGGVLLVSQFTLYADCRKGRRPSFSRAAEPKKAAGLYTRLVRDVSEAYHGPVASGEFGARMDVHGVNQGPVTVWLDSDELFGRGSG